ncbi:MAG: Lrp/AsnC ligand binding domain-containing protein [Ancrocorticia sp.]
MITAIVHVDVDTALIPEAARAIASIDGVSEAFSVTGDHDVIAIVRVNHHQDLAEVIPEHIGKVPGVTGITTYLAFQTFSQEMLDEAFHIGLD